jgi:hypothetical protein
MIAGVILAALPANAQVPRGATNMAVGQVNIGTTATLVVPVRSGRIRVTLANGTANNVWCGPDNTVTIITGDVLQGSTNQGTGSHKDYEYQGEIWCVATTPSTVTFHEIW